MRSGQSDCSPRCNTSIRRWRTCRSVFPSTRTASSFEATLDRLSVTANVYIGGGLSAFGNYTKIWVGSDEIGFEEQLLLVPEHAARIGLNYVSPQMVNLFISETYLGKRPTYPDSFSSGLVTGSDLLEVRRSPFMIT